MYLNSNQKKGLIYLSTAGALLLGKKQKSFELNYPFLTYWLKEVDNNLIKLSSNLTNKDRKQIKKMIKSMDNDPTNDEFENVLMTYIALDWCLYNAFNSNKFKQLQKSLKQSTTRLLNYLKKIKSNYSKEEIINILIKFYEEVIL